MSKRKKSRKPGLIGVRKDPNFAGKSSTKQKPAKASKGNPSGSRQHVTTTKKRSQGQTKNNDPRHGSKKPIALITTQQKKTYATPAEELAALEADTRLIALLDKVEKGETLRAEQQYYVDEKLARHAVLCDLLGITQEDEEEDDPYKRLDAISLEEFDESDEK